MSEDLKNIIEKSGLEDSDKKIWEEVIQKGDPALLGILNDFLKKEHNSLPLLTKLLKKKMEAIQRNDPNLWREIIDEEVEEIKKI